MIAAVLDHLWQSTLFAAGAGLLALLLRRNAAAIRYRLWFAASMKFLVPFSMLAACGARLVPASHSAFIAPAQAHMFEQATQPFVDVTPLLAGPAAPAVPMPPATPHFDLELALMMVWGAGFLVVAIVWAARWVRIWAVARSASPLDWPAPVPVRISPSLLEPGVVGIWRPILVFPEGLTTGLEPAQIKAIVAHELCHLRRRDNLTAALHMLVAALFWFVPPVWWIGGRLIAERERACDEAVVESGHDPQTYAQGILKVCRHYLQSPLACVAGVSGANLSKRMETIMTAPPSRPLGLGAKALLGAAGVVALASPVAAGVLAASPVVQSVVRAPVALALAPVLPAQAPVAPTAQPSQAPKPIALAQNQPPSPATGAAKDNTFIPSADEVGRMLAEQQQPRQLVAFDPDHFDKYVGHYQQRPGSMFTITRDGGKFFSQLTGQSPVQVYPESETKFFATVVAAQVSFTVDQQGNVNELVLHQGGLEQHFKKIDETTARDVGSALAQRVAANKPSPETEAFLRRYIESQEAGRPDYSGMGVRLADAAQNQQGRMTNDIKTWGPLLSIKFNSVNAQGNDAYTLVFKYAEIPAIVSPPGPDGKVTGLGFMPPADLQPSNPEIIARVQANRPNPGTQDSVRKWLEALEAGQPNYDDMTPGMAYAARSQWPQTSQVIKGFGALKDVRFLRVRPDGRDVYEADFDNNKIQVVMGPLTADGKVGDRGWQILP